MTQQGMVLRRDILVGGGQRRVELPPAHRPVFEEGAALIFTRWTALQLGVQNEWGGSKSAQKAQELLQDVIGWFYNTKGAAAGCPRHMHASPCRRRHCRRRCLPLAACSRSPPCFPPSPPSTAPDHEMCDLQDLLEEALQLDFNIQAEDDSPYQARAAGRAGGGACRRRGHWPLKPGCVCTASATATRAATAQRRQSAGGWQGSTAGAGSSRRGTSPAANLAAVPSPPPRTALPRAGGPPAGQHAQPGGRRRLLVRGADAGSGGAGGGRGRRQPAPGKRAARGGRR